MCRSLRLSLCSLLICACATTSALADINMNGINTEALGNTVSVLGALAAVIKTPPKPVLALAPNDEQRANILSLLARADRQTNDPLAIAIHDASPFIQQALELDSCQGDGSQGRSASFKSSDLSACADVLQIDQWAMSADDQLSFVAGFHLAGQDGLLYRHYVLSRVASGGWRVMQAEMDKGLTR